MERASDGTDPPGPAAPVDLLVIGGGVNGCGIARDAAGRGLSVVLCERGDLAAATSSASTKLIHGGLRYLEQGAFRLVREGLREREVLLRMAPHLVRPMRFVLPVLPGARPAWLLRLGLFVYDRLAGRDILPASRSCVLAGAPLGAPLRAEIARGFEYSDCRVDDSRLVVLNAVDAAARGAEILPRHRVVSAARQEAGGLWRIGVVGSETGATRTFRARALVNAAGPWVADVLRLAEGGKAPARVRLVRGSHIVVPRLFSHDAAYVFQQRDGRIVFAIPYEDAFTLVGTTDVDHGDDPDVMPVATADEVAYLCHAVAAYFRSPVTPTDVVYAFSGVRALHDDGAAKAKDASRDYALRLDAPAGAAPLLSVFGGKVTTYRRLAEAALEKLSPFLPNVHGPWTADSALPGGDFAWDGLDALVAALEAAHPFLGAAQARRLARAYGTRAFDILAGCRNEADLGRDLGGGLTEREVEYLARVEFAGTGEDVLWRRSKLGLRLTPDAAAAVDACVRAAARRCAAPVNAP